MENVKKFKPLSGIQNLQETETFTPLVTKWQIYFYQTLFYVIMPLKIS